MEEVKTSEKKMSYIKDFNKANYYRLIIYFNKNTTEGQLCINKLDSVPSKAGYIKELILKDLKKNAE